MTLTELKNKIREILPNAHFDLNNYGEVIIHTNLQTENGGDLEGDNQQLIEYWNSGRIQSMMREGYDDHDDYYDDSMDGDHDSAMESAGWGTDEDYGYYGED
jgi:hypothetical protein